MRTHTDPLLRPEGLLARITAPFQIGKMSQADIHGGRESDFRVSFSLFTFGHSKFTVAKSEIYGHFTFGEGQKVKSRPFTFGAPEAVKSVFCLAWRCGVWTTLASSDQSRDVKCS